MSRLQQKIAWMLLVAALGCRTAGVHPTSGSPGRRAARTQLAETSDRVEVGTLARASELSVAPAAESVHQVSAEAIDATVGAASGLTLPDTVSLGLAQNPDLVAQRQAENVGSAALGVAQTYPFNPFVQVQATPYQNTRDPGLGTTYHYVLLMQTIQLAHQQQFREAAGAASLNSIRWNIHQAELLNVAQTERLYFNVLYQRGLRDVASSLDANNRQLLQVLEKQLAAGQATAADVAIVRIDARSTRQQVRLAEANYQTALRDLRRQLGMSPDADVQFPGDLRTVQWRLPFDEPTAGDRGVVLIEYAASRPDVMAARSDVDTARANLCLATANRTPDLQVGPYYQRTTDGTTFLGFRAQMDILVVNTGRPLEDQRQAELGQRVAMWQQLSRRAQLEAQAAWERYELAFAAVQSDAAALTATLPEELRRLEEQFVAGEVDVVRVVQARNSLIQNQRAQLDLLNELSQAAAALTAASGLPIESLLQSATPE